MPHPPVAVHAEEEDNREDFVNKKHASAISPAATAAAILGSAAPQPSGKPRSRWQALLRALHAACALYARWF
jgi:hypothetical protein